MRETQKVNRKHHFPLLLVFSIIVCASSILALAAKYAREFRMANKSALPIRRSQAVPPPEAPDGIQFSAIPARIDDSSGLLNGDFKIARKMSELTRPCEKILNNSFVTPSGLPPSVGQVRLADPEEEFEATDSVRGGLPFRRLVFAGLGSSICFVYYERGGLMYPSSCLAIFDYGQKKPIWVGESARKAKTVDELRHMLSGREFHNPTRPGC